MKSEYLKSHIASAGIKVYNDMSAPVEIFENEARAAFTRTWNGDEDLVDYLKARIQ